jgi:signal transduction histidine kinase
VAEADPDFETWAELLTGLQREDRRLEGLVSDLLTLARYDEGPVGGPRTEVDIDQVLGRVADRTARAEPQVVVDSSGIEPARVLGDAAALERLFWNLSLNAARYGNSRVALSCHETGGTVTARVVDDGLGIAAVDHNRVFDRFVRLDEARGRDEGGTGLGLSVARAIARSHGGDVRIVDSTEGTTIEVDLPALR